MTADGVNVIEGAGWLEMCADEVVLIRSDDPKHQPVAAVKLSERLWVTIGDEPPARLLQVTANRRCPAPWEKGAGRASLPRTSTRRADRGSQGRWPWAIRRYGRVTECR